MAGIPWKLYVVLFDGFLTPERPDTHTGHFGPAFECMTVLLGNDKVTMCRDQDDMVLHSHAGVIFYDGYYYHRATVQRDVHPGSLVVFDPVRAIWPE